MDPEEEATEEDDEATLTFPVPRSPSTASRARSAPGWMDMATSADHKDVAKILMVGSGGFLFLAALELLPDAPAAGDPGEHLHGAVHLQPDPLALRRHLDLLLRPAAGDGPLPLHRAAAGGRAGHRAAAALSQIGGALWVAGAVVLYSGFLWTPSEAGVNPLPPLSELAFLSNNGVDAWLTACGFATLGFVLIAVDLATTLQVDRAPGMAWRRAPIFAWAAAVGSWLMLFIGPVLLAAFTMLMIDRNYGGTFFADGGGGAPLLWQHFTWIFYSGAYMLVLIFAFAAIAEIFSVFSGNPIFNRRAVMTSIVAIAVIGTLA